MNPFKYLFEGIWRDEAFSYLLAKQPLIDLIVLTAKDFNPPLYYLVLKAWMVIFGSTELSIRGLSILFYVVAVFCTYELIKLVFKKSTLTTIIATTLFTLNPLTFYYAFEGRMYTMLLMFSIMSTFFLLTKQKKFYIFSLILGLYTHYFMIFAIASQAVYVLITEVYPKRSWRSVFQALTPFVIAGLAFLPWVIFFLTQNTNVNNPFWISALKPMDYSILPGYVFSGIEKDFAVSFRADPKALHFLQVFSFFCYFVAGIAILYVWKTKKHVKEILLLLLSVIVPLVLILIVAPFKPLFVPRYLIFVSSMISLVVITVSFIVPRTLQIVLIGILLFFMVQFHQIQLHYRTRSNIKTVAAQIKPLLLERDVVYVKTELDYMEAVYYLGEDKVFIYGKTYDQIPSFVGKVLIPESALTSVLPPYPAKAFVISSTKAHEFTVESAFF